MPLPASRGINVPLIPRRCSPAPNSLACSQGSCQRGGDFRLLLIVVVPGTQTCFLQGIHVLGRCWCTSSSPARVAAPSAASAKGATGFTSAEPKEPFPFSLGGEATETREGRE
jgi:hypothetical protein